MQNLVEHIHVKKFDVAKSVLFERMQDILARKLVEMKKMVAAKITEGNTEDIKTAKRLGMDHTSIPAVKEAGKMAGFHKNLMGDLKDRVGQMKKQIQAHKDAGLFPMEVGTRFHTDHSRQNKLHPWTVTGHYVDSKDPEGRYGYHVERPDEKSIFLIRNRKVEDQIGKDKWDEIQKGITPFKPLSVIKEEAEALIEGRYKIVKARIRNGKIQRRKKVSNIGGYTIRNGQVTRMSPAERRRRKLGQKRGKIKRRSKRAIINMRRNRSMRKRKAMGIG